MNWLIATDLDGTLLDDSVTGAEAAAALDRLAATYPDARIALASSKTPAEVIELVRCCATDPILIFENGTGLAWREPALCQVGTQRIHGFEISNFGIAYPEVIKTLYKLRSSRGYPFRGFSDMTPLEVSSLTGQSPVAAKAARDRVGSEPICWQGTAAELDDFTSALAREGLDLVPGGRFHYVGSHLDKGRALAKLWRLLRFQFGIHPRIVACGDAPNDLPMLERADHAIVFPRRDGGYLEPENPNTRRAPTAGPMAWLSAVTGLLDRHYEEAAV